ncbi:SHOCT domain-containing protein [Arcobacter arenosus]|uniref:SHOCT domain-containing protein n=1 Tax=Arcobacter arenosus TaxID=2576037 RepID=A0A5R8Y1Y3_9BACT|nr:SHOCT domain-containing protein [Arcobacter arenosus]TLP39253.1 SHOCT domain-containing protein [Arcobacter arenosus]
MYGYMNMNMTMFHGLGMLIFWFIVFFLIFSFFSKDKEKKEETPLNILKKRLAKGEISKEEYDELKKTLSK